MSLCLIVLQVYGFDLHRVCRHIFDVSGNVCLSRGHDVTTCFHVVPAHIDQ